MGTDTAQYLRRGLRGKKERLTISEEIVPMSKDDRHWEGRGKQILSEKNYCPNEESLTGGTCQLQRCHSH